MKEKKCSRCKEIKPLSEFYKMRLGNDGIQCWCKTCQKSKSREIYREDPIKAQEINRKWCKHNRNKVRSAASKWRKNNRERVRFMQREWEKNHIELRQEYRRRRKTNHPKYDSLWKKNNPDRVNLWNRNRHARLMKASGNGWNIEQEERLKKLYNYCCAYCGKRTKLTMDHIVPLIRGGTHSIENIAPACRSCNSSKQDKSILLWILGKE